MNKDDKSIGLPKVLEDYFDNIEIPSELDQVIEKAIKEATTPKRKVIKMKKWIRNLATTAAICTVGFVGAANFSPAFAQSISDVPLLSTLIKVVTFTQFHYEDDTYNASLEAPIIEGLGDSDLQNTLNEKYIAENKKLYEQFEKEIDELKSANLEAHMGIDTGYEVKTDTEQILSIARYVLNTAGSSSTTMTFDTIDKQNNVLITLPSLFVDDSYIDMISSNIKEQMRDRMAKDSNMIYWIGKEDPMVEGFDTIAADQDFYISSEGKLIISFDKYMVGPGYMGIQEFEIPTEVLQPTLVSNAYIK